jgi:hypothetical protein
MGRRSTPERIYQARRAAVLSMLVQADRIAEDRAERLVTAWESEAVHRGLDRESSAFWDGAEARIQEHLSSRK